MSKMKLALDVVQDLRNLADSLEALAGAALGAPPTEATPVVLEKPNASEPAKPTLVELRAFVAEKSTPENRPRIKAILEKYDVRKLTELPEEKYPALLREVEAL